MIDDDMTDHSAPCATTARLELLDLDSVVTRY